MSTIQVLAIAGSARAGSFNRRLATYAAGRVRAADVAIREFDLRALQLPVYDADLEASAGVAPGALQLHAALAASHALLVVTPEYNGFPPPLLINAFDWLSRIPASDTAPSGLAVTAGKPAGLLSASPGPAGALRSMNYVRQYLQMAFAMLVVPQQFALGKAHQAFDESGNLIDAGAVRAVDGVLVALSGLARALAAPH